MTRLQQLKYPFSRPDVTTKLMTTISPHRLVGENISLGHSSEWHYYTNSPTPDGETRPCYVSSCFRALPHRTKTTLFSGDLPSSSGGSCNNLLHPEPWRIRPFTRTFMPVAGEPEDVRLTWKRSVSCVAKNWKLTTISIPLFNPSLLQHKPGFCGGESGTDQLNRSALVRAEKEEYGEDTGRPQSRG